MVREMGSGILALAVLAMVAPPLVACGEVRRVDRAKDNSSGGSGAASGFTGSGGSGVSSGATGGSHGGSNGVSGATGGAATAGSNGAAGEVGAAGETDAGGTGVGGAGDGESASFHWIEGTKEHRERAASAIKPAFLQTLVRPPFDASVLIGSSELHIGTEQFTEGIVWTEATGTTGLGGLPGVTPSSLVVFSDAYASSADGSVVVGIATNSQHAPVPFRWTRADGMEALAEGGVAVAVSSDGSVVFGDRNPPLGGLFRWTRELGAVTIVEPLPGDDALRVVAISDDGATLVGESRKDTTATHLFLWKEGVGTRAIANLPGYAVCLVGPATYGPSHGFVAGGTCYDENGYKPFLWAGQDELVALGPADALGGYESESLDAVTADGSVAVGVATRGADDSRVYRWTDANGFELIKLPDGHASSTLAPSPALMSADGSVVVGRMDGAQSHSFLWSESAGAIVLSPLEGHDLSIVMAVSADGSVAAGSSRLSGGASTAVYWRADGVPHRIADELVAQGIDLGAGALTDPQAALTPLGFFGYGSKGAVGTRLAWRARLP